MVRRPVKVGHFERPLVVVLCAAFVAALEYVYAGTDSRLFSFYGLRYEDIGLFWHAVGFAMAVAPSLWMPIRLQRPSMVAYWILYLTVIVPVTWIPFHTLRTPPADYLPYSGVLLVCFYALGWSFRLPRWKVPRPQVSQDVFLFAVLAVVGAMTLAVWSTNGFRFDLGLQSVYERRYAARESVPMGTFMAYVKGNLASALQPFAFAIGIARGSVVLILLSLFAGLVGFSVDGNKTSAAVPLFLLALYPLLTRYRRSFGIALPACALALVLGVAVAYAATNEIRVPVLTTWRLFDVKGLLTGYYWEYFSANPKMNLSDGVLRPFLTSPYPYAAPQQIGLTYFGSPETNSNANLWASGYGDFGFFGMGAVTLALAFVFRFIDSMALNRGFLIPAFLASFLGMKLSDVAFDTSLLSHGTIAILLLIYILPPLQRELKEVAWRRPQPAQA